MQFQKIIFNTLKKLKILVIDSSPIIYIGLKSIFKKLPIEFIPTSSFTYNNLSSLEIKKNTILISCGKKSVKASVYLKIK